MKPQFSLASLWILVGILTTALAMWIPSFLATHRASNERRADIHLRVLSRAQRDFRDNDRDGNGVQDFWTADVAGLAIVRPLERDGTPGPTGLALIAPDLAAADGDFTFASEEYRAQLSPWERPFESFAPLSGYLFRAARLYGVEPVEFREDTDPSPYFGKVHSRQRFALMTYPAGRSSGRLSFIVNEDFTQYKINLADSYWLEYEGTREGSHSNLTGSGTQVLDSAIYPWNPSAIGFSKYD